MRDRGDDGDDGGDDGSGGEEGGGDDDDGSSGEDNGSGGAGDTETALSSGDVDDTTLASFLARAFQPPRTRRALLRQQVPCEWHSGSWSKGKCR